MLTEEEKKRAVSEERKTRRVELELFIQEGISAERLSINSDWAKLKAHVSKHIIAYEADKIASYDAILSRAVEWSEKFKAVDMIRAWNQQIDNFKFIIELPASFIKKGNESREELEKLNKEESHV